ncbi:MAG: hypothetical protein DRR08_29295 [Candidatus Parabeggiatoa sp. nov. 2]|nr:MAG: hypothetical protein B6247_31155 [Beggiatoa sp. 4572_84]RKZ51437.1 MAG: hypothetical protein DRR08_29295 [Gammaproteobacteria bacterium]
MNNEKCPFYGPGSVIELMNFLLFEVRSVWRRGKIFDCFKYRLLLLSPHLSGQSFGFGRPALSLSALALALQF